MSNLRIYEAARSVPNEAQKEIKGGKLRGMTDINPMWRIKKLTELYGPCGTGWKYEIVDKMVLPGADGEQAIFVDILLYVKDGEAWSDPIPGTGGSMLVNTEKGKLVTSDECFKMALTDAISVSCKALGFGADIYWSKDRTKYSAPPEDGAPPPGGKAADKQEPERIGQNPKVFCEECGLEIEESVTSTGVIRTPAYVAAYTKDKYGKALCNHCATKAANAG